MRNKYFQWAAVCVAFAALACNVSGGGVSTAIAEGKGAAGTAAALLTDVGGTMTAQAASTLPSGGGPSETPASGTPLAETPAVTVPPAPSSTPTPHLRVAFISGTNPWIVEPPAAPLQLSSAGSVDGVYLSSDGLRVVYTHRPVADGPAEVRVVNSDGSGDRALLTSAQVGALEAPGSALFTDVNLLQWIPGTHRIFLSTRGQFEGPGLARNDDQFVIDTDSGTVTPVFTPGNGGDVHPSPDGTKMAVSRGTSVSVCSIDGTGMHSSVISFPVIITYSEYTYVPSVVWAGDSSRFGVIIPSPDPFAASTNGAIWMVDGASGAATNVSTLNGIFFLPLGVLSPTLDRVGFIRPAADPSLKDSYVSALDGSAALHLGSDANTAVLSFAPDGQHFAYSVGAPATVFIGSLGGGTVAVPGSVMRLAWINSSQFVFSQGTMSSWTLQLGNVSGAASLIASPAGDRTAFDAVE
jgi:hypothetical protein